VLVEEAPDVKRPDSESKLRISVPRCMAAWSRWLDGRTVKPISALARLFIEIHGAAQSDGQKGVALGRREEGTGAALKSFACSSSINLFSQ